jgi:signal transduction histidine kinase/ligand-binding sensor domain-containing protein
VWLLAGAGSLICAQTVPAKQYRYDQWTAESGLPQNIVRGIAQTPDGYLWISTLDGLARFDGVRFTVFDKSNTPGIDSNRFRSMVEDQDGDLWLDNESGNVTRCHRGEFRTYGPENGIPSNSIRGISVDDQGNLWMLSDEAISKWDKAKGELVDVTPANLRIHYEGLRWDNAGFWGYDASGLHIFSRGMIASYRLPAWAPGNSIWQVGVAGDGSVWIETHDGKQGVVPAGKLAVEPADPEHPRFITYRDPHEHIWTMHVEGRLRRYLDFQSSGQRASIPLDRFLEDHEGNVWIGTEGSGLYRLQEQSIMVYSKAQGLKESNIFPVYQDRAGAIWMGAWETGLSRYANGKITNFTPAEGLPGRLVTALTEDHEGGLWIGLYGGLAVYRNGQFRTPVGIELPEHAVVQAILQDRGGTVWIGTSNGLIVYRDGPSRTLRVQDGLAADDVRAIVETSSGDLWFGGYGGLTRLHGGKFTRWTERDGLPSDNVRAVYADSDGVTWIGTYDGGLGRYQDGKLTRYTERDGLFSNGVFQILEDRRGNLWMSCNRGIYRVSKRELNAFAAGRLSSITSVAYGKTDGLLNEECNGGAWPAGIVARDSTLWFPTEDGVAVVDPKTIRLNPQPPPVVIEAARIDRAPASISSLLHIAPGKENLEIEYTALSFVHAAQINFRYRLEGLDSNWIDAGTRRIAYYSHLPPGNYTFRVIAANSDGVWNDQGQSLSIAVLAPFYRRWWFTALEGLAVAALILFAVRMRFSRLQHRQALQRAFSQQLIASQESERQRIAAELHDSLGQHLVIINNLALISKNARKKAGIAVVQAETDALEEISVEASLAIQETREISYNLRPFQLDRLGLTRAIESMVRAVASASGIHITSDLDNIDGAFPEELRIHFYRVVQESVNNIMKHAQATEAEVRVALGEGRMVLTVRDNGAGFNMGSRPAQGGTSGFGLTGMAERAHSLGGSFRMRSAPGQGTVVTVEIPLGGEHRG